MKTMAVFQFSKCQKVQANAVSGQCNGFGILGQEMRSPDRLFEKRYNNQRGKVLRDINKATAGFAPPSPQLFSEMLLKVKHVQLLHVTTNCLFHTHASSGA
uniref:Uncharacterized protein n=1 Tax=Photinus pyralis TaxID=7054 RepID=A0A1Y1LFI7_PHOPY